MQVEQASVEAVGVDEARRLLGEAGLTLSSLGAGPVAPLRDGGDVIAVPSGPLEGMTHEEAADRTRAWFEAHAPRAADGGRVLAFEPIHPLLRHFAWVHTLRHALTLTDGIEGAGVMVDVAHL